MKKKKCDNFCNGPASGKPTLPCKGGGLVVRFLIRCVTFCQCLAGGWCRGVKHHVKFLQGVAVPHQRGCGEDFSEVYSFLSRSCCRTHAEKSAVRC